MPGHWAGHYPVVITEFHSDMFHVSFGCEGDRRRVLNKEPWHFQNHLIVLLTPDARLNVSKEDLIFTPFWIQIYRLPFLSKTTALAEALGNTIGQFVEVFEDSTNEGWGPFLRVRVKLCVTKPLLRGQMIRLSSIKDEFWIDYWYERFPEFCFECGILGHPYEQCVSFMERMDNRNDDDLPYGPWLKGARLLTNSYDRYRTDFCKANAWPFLTRLARQSLVSAVPRLTTPSFPHPNPLHDREKDPPITFPRPQMVSTTTPIAISPQPQPPHTLDPSPSTFSAALTTNPYQAITPSSTVPTVQNIKGKNVLGTPFNPNFTSTDLSSLDNIPNSTTSTKLQPKVSVADFSHIYVPDLDSAGQSSNVFATYPPPTPTTLPTSSLKSLSLSNTIKPTQSISISTTFAPAASHDKENIPPTITTKRQCDSVSMRKLLKRCRGVGSQSTTFFTPDLTPESVVSSNEDSIDSLDYPAMVAPQPRHSS
uniref:Zinc knuckle CX2CX4HX4C domain-containing protein n=1 Tax=Cannabis sativa TaxID=3483 RepID=A0A803QCS4_CANSA